MQSSGPSSHSRWRSPQATTEQYDSSMMAFPDTVHQSLAKSVSAKGVMTHAHESEMRLTGGRDTRIRKRDCGLVMVYSAYHAYSSVHSLPQFTLVTESILWEGPQASVQFTQSRRENETEDHASALYISNRQFIMAGFPNGLQVGGSLCQLAINLNGYG